MAVKSISISEYDYTLEDDTEEPKTIFTLSPMKKMEHFVIAGLINKLTSQENDVNDNFIALTEKSESIVYGYLQKHLVKVKDFEVEGKLKSGNGSEYVDLIDASSAIEIISDAVRRATADSGTQKNSV